MSVCSRYLHVCVAGKFWEDDNEGRERDWEKENGKIELNFYTTIRLSPVKKGISCAVSSMLVTLGVTEKWVFWEWNWAFGDLPIKAWRLLVLVCHWVLTGAAIGCSRLALFVQKKD